MPNDLINALLGQETEVPRGPSPFGAEPPRPEDAISNLYRSNAPKSTWLHDLAMKTMMGPQTGSIARDVAGFLPTASLALRPSGVSYTNTPRPTLRTQGKIRSMDRPPPRHSAENMYPNIVAGQAAANFPWPGADEFRGFQNPKAAPATPQQATPAQPLQPNYNDIVNDRFGSMAPPTREMPPPESLALQSGRFMPQTGSFAAPSAPVPMPRPNPLPPKDFINPILLTKPYPKKREADLAPIPEYMKYQDSGLMHMQEGGFNPDGKPMIVGEGGDGSNEEVVIPHGPTTVIPHSLAVQSGMIDAPTGAFPETGRERRSRKSGQFDSALKDFVSSPSNLLSLAGPAGVTAAMAMENQNTNKGPEPVGGIKAKPETVAGFAEPRPVLSREDQVRLNVLNTEIEKHRATIAKYEGIKNDNPRVYSQRTADAQAKLQTLVPQLAAIEGPHRKNTEDWQNRLNAHMTKQNEALFNRQQKEADATTSFQTKNPDWGNEAPKWGAGVEGILGGITGLASKGSLAKKLLKGGLAGMGTGALLSATPNLIDAGNLPLGSQAQKDAFWNMLTPDMATKVASDAVLGGGIGAASTYGTSTIKDGVNALVKLLKGPATRASSIPKAKIPLPTIATQPPPMATQPPPFLPEAAAPTPAVKRARKKKTTE